MLELETGHRCHAEIENAIRDLKYGVGLNHLPSGRFRRQRSLAGSTGDGPQSGPLDRAHRSGRDGGDHQDPPAAPLFPGRTHHPQGPAPHTASPQALALGNPVPLRPGAVADHSTPGLTPPDGTSLPINQIECPQPTRTNQVGEGSLLTAVPRSVLPKATPGHHCPTLPANDSTVGPPIPLISHSRDHMAPHRWIWVYVAPFLRDDSEVVAEKDGYHLPIRHPPQSRHWRFLIPWSKGFVDSVQLRYIRGPRLREKRQTASFTFETVSSKVHPWVTMASSRQEATKQPSLSLM